MLELKDGSAYRVCTVKDITEEKEYLNLLVESQKKAVVGGWEYDVVNNRLRWTDQVFEIYEMDKNEQPDLDDAFKYFDTQSRQNIQDAFNKARDSGESYELDLKLKTARGNEKWVRATGKPIRVYDRTVKIYGAFQDISSLRRSELERERLSSVVRNTQNAIVILDPDKKIEWVNNSYEKLTGYRFDEVKGKSPKAFLYGPDSDEKTLEYIDSKLDACEPFEAEIKNYRKNGNTFWKRMEATPHYDEEGKLINYSSVQVDVTEQVQQKKRLEQLLEEQRILLQEIHHRVKNNLAVISSLLTLQADEMDDERLKDILRESQYRIQMIGRIHEKLYQSDSMSHVGIDKYLEDICENIIDTFKDQGQEIEFDMEADKIHLNINQAIPFGLIVNELVTNAAKHGVADQNDGKIKLVLSGVDGVAELSIEDNGSGLPEDFDPYLGDSMGMMLVTTLVEQLDGEFDYQNSERGAVFTVRFEVVG